MTKMIKRTFGVFGETKDQIFVVITLKDYSGRVETWLPKNRIKITNRVYGWGGAKAADIEFPIELASLFKPAKN